MPRYACRQAQAGSELATEIFLAGVPSAGPRPSLSGMRKIWGEFAKPVRVGPYLYDCQSRPDLWARAENIKKP